MSRSGGCTAHPAPQRRFAAAVDRQSQRRRVSRFVGGHGCALGRGYGIEIDSQYVDTAVRRWQRYSGKLARLDGSNATFEEIADRRSSSSPRHDVGDTKHENG
jgi:hypothetical protein